VWRGARKMVGAVLPSKDDLKSRFNEIRKEQLEREEKARQMRARQIEQNEKAKAAEKERLAAVKSEVESRAKERREALVAREHKVRELREASIAAFQAKLAEEKPLREAEIKAKTEMVQAAIISASEARVEKEKQAREKREAQVKTWRDREAAAVKNVKASEREQALENFRAKARAEATQRQVATIEKARKDLDKKHAAANKAYRRAPVQEKKQSVSTSRSVGADDASVKSESGLLVSASPVDVKKLREEADQAVKSLPDRNKQIKADREQRESKFKSEMGVRILAYQTAAAAKAVQDDIFITEKKQEIASRQQEKRQEYLEKQSKATTERQDHIKRHYEEAKVKAESEAEEQALKAQELQQRLTEKRDLQRARDAKLRERISTIIKKK